MFDLIDQCVFTKINQNILTHCDNFSCGALDLDDFLYNDSLAYEKDLMGKTYCWILKKDPKKLVGFVTVANTGIQTTHLQNNPKRHLNKTIARKKQGRSYPAVLIGRVAVSKDFQGRDYRVGSQIMRFIKDWFIASDNKTGCRYIVVDAVNAPGTLSYYERNGFKPLFRNDSDEKVFYSVLPTEILRTRMYYFDLLLHS